MAEEAAQFIEHLACDTCGSSDANSLWTDGHLYCFSCGHYTPPKDNPDQRRPDIPKKEGGKVQLIRGEVKGIRKRGITEETARKFGYMVGKFKRKDDTKRQPVQIAPYYDKHGSICAQKLKFPDKDFLFLGNKAKATLFGQNLWAKGGRMVVVTEGEVDAMSVSQLQGNKWPVVSVPNGAQGAAKSLNKHMDWLLTFDSVILMFDQDEAGQEAAEECGSLFPPKRCYVASLPLKDANEMLVADRGREVIQSIWKARPWSPGSVMTLADIKDEVMTPVEWGMDWPWPSLTKATYGIQRPAVYTLGAGTGIGKTDVFTQIAAHVIEKLDLPIGVMFMEQQPGETGQRLAGKAAGKRFHVPDADWTTDELRETVDRLAESNKVHLYGSWGGDWETVESSIRFWAGEGIKDIFIDHLTAMVAGAEDERKALEEIMSELASLAVSLNITIYLISHLSTPDGTPHEEGGRVMIRHFKGSRAIGYWSFFMFGLERDQHAEDPDEAQTTYFRILKDRYTGQSTGQVIPLRYQLSTGLLIEAQDMDPFDTDDTDQPEEASHGKPDF